MCDWNELSIGMLFPLTLPSTDDSTKWSSILFGDCQLLRGNGNSTVANVSFGSHETRPALRAHESFCVLFTKVLYSDVPFLCIFYELEGFEVSHLKSCLVMQFTIIKFRFSVFEG